jgi:TonB family protein
MNNLLLYLLKVSAGITLLYLGYLLFFRKDTFYLRNRIFLMLTLIIPAILPLIKIPVISGNPVTAEPAGVFAGLIYAEPSPLTAAAGAIQSEPVDIYPILTGIYFAAAGLLLLRVLISLLSTYAIIKKGTIRTNHFPKVITTESQFPPFSFFPFVVVPAEDFNTGNCNDILDHEFAHIKQGHTFDLILGELFIAFQWFNPFVWLVKRSMILNHEYLADKVSLITNKCSKEYQYRLLNLQPRLKHISLVHSFDSLIKNRIIMINKTPSPRLAAVKNIIILPVVAIAVYAFATPEYYPAASPATVSALEIYEPIPIVQKAIKGIVLTQDGKPLEGANIMCTGAPGFASSAVSGSDGRFVINNAQEDAYIMASCTGYKRVSVKAVFTSEMTIKMEKDPEYKEPAKKVAQPKILPSAVDGVLTDQDLRAVTQKMGDEVARISFLNGKDAIEKYGEKGKDGVYEIMSVKKAAELGIKIPLRRRNPEDFPTFRSEKFTEFTKWVIDNVKYPADAQSKGIQGRVYVSFTVELDGSLSNISVTGAPDQVLGEAVRSVVKSSPAWEPAKNPNIKEACQTSVTVKFVLPDKVLPDDAFVVVEKMPKFPGEDAALMKFVRDNIQYPPEAAKANIQGRVILKFVINTEGKVEDVTVLKSVDPLLDKEAVRVVKTLPDWVPATQGGTPRSVYYSIPVTFALEAKSVSQGLILSKPSGADFYRFLSMNIIYPEVAKETLDTGVVYVIAKLTKGGASKEFTAVTDPKQIKVPLTDEVVVVAYGPSDTKGSAINKGSSGNDHPLLKAECLRIANKLTVKEIPEWENNNMEFAMKFKFIIK